MLNGGSAADDVLSGEKVVDVCLYTGMSRVMASLSSHNIVITADHQAQMVR